MTDNSGSSSTGVDALVDEVAALRRRVTWLTVLVGLLAVALGATTMWLRPRDELTVSRIELSKGGDKTVIDGRGMRSETGGGPEATAHFGAMGVNLHTTLGSGATVESDLGATSLRLGKLPRGEATDEGVTIDYFEPSMSIYRDGKRAQIGFDSTSPGKEPAVSIGSVRIAPSSLPWAAATEPPADD